MTVVVLDLRTVSEHDDTDLAALVVRHKPLRNEMKEISQGGEGRGLWV